MLPHLISWIQSLLLHNQNQFASGGLLLMGIGAIGASLRSVPHMIYDRVLHLFSMTITINDDSKSFIWFKWWFHQQERAKSIRHVDVITPNTSEGVEVILFPSPGAHWFMYNGRPFRMVFSRTEEKKAAFNGTRPETLELRVLGRDQKFLWDFVRDVKAKFECKNFEAPQLHFLRNGYWDEMPFTPRSFESVILPDKIKSPLIKDIEEFQHSRLWYEDCGIPYHRSYLLYGPPGTGKTSTLLGLASHFKMDLYLMKLAAITDQVLIEALHAVNPNSMIVFEDIDCLHKKRDGLSKDKKKKSENEEGKASFLTLSGLLNALDGIETPHGSLFFMTTNLIDKLDPALLRPGRVDVKIYLGPATDEQKEEMYKRFFPGLNDAKEFIEANPKVKTMAEFQEALKLLKHRRKNAVD